MGNKLNEQQKLQAVVDYAECHNYSEVARKYGVTDNTIRRIVEANADFFENVEKEKELAAEDVLTHMSKQLGKVNLIIDKFLDRLSSDELIKNGDLYEQQKPGFYNSRQSPRFNKRRAA